MNRTTGSIIVALLLMALGTMLLLQNFGIFAAAWGLLWAVLFGLAGAAFLTVVIADRKQWWAFIPAFTLLGLSGITFTSTLFPHLPGAMTGAAFLGMIGLGFWAVYLSAPRNWWAVIPGGVLFTLALVSLVSNFFSGHFAGGLFFFGLAATFGVVFVMPTADGRQQWAIFPAGACFLMGALVLATLPGLFNWVGPLALIAAGAFLVIRAVNLRQA